MTEQEINNLIDSKIGKTKMSQLPEATQTSGLYSIGYTGNQSVKYKANLLQGDPLTVRKTYQTEAEALADKNPIDATTSLPLKIGQFVSIVDDGEKNGIYRISSISVDGTMSLELQGKLGDLSGYTKTGGSTKTTKEVEDEIVRLAGKISLKNLVTNGNFAEGTTGWTTINANMTVTSEEMSFTASDQNGALQSSKMSLITGNKYYIAFRYKFDASEIQFSIAGLSGSTTVTTANSQWNRHSYIWQSGVTGEYAIRVRDVRASVFTAQYIDDVIVIDLTSTYGEGNEPSASEMDSIINGYFDGYFDEVPILPAMMKSISSLSSDKLSSNDVFDNNDLTEDYKHTIVDDYYVANTTGAITPLSGESYIEIPVVENKFIYFLNEIGSFINLPHFGVYKNNNGDWIANFTPTNNYLNAVQIFKVPAGATKLFINFQTIYFNRFKVLKDIGVSVLFIKNSLISGNPDVVIENLFHNSPATKIRGVLRSGVPYLGSGDVLRMTPLIKCQEGDIFKVENYSTIDNPASSLGIDLTHFDENGLWIEEITNKNTDPYEHIIPEGVGYVSFNFFEDAAPNLSVKKISSPNSATKIRRDAIFPAISDSNVNTWDGVQWVSFGDSLTFRNLWQPYLVTKFGLIHTNCGIGSTRLAGTDANAFWQDLRLNAVKSADPSLVTILGGANDLTQDIPIGTDAEFDKTLANKDKTTFKGAYSYIIEKLLSWKPSLRIVILTTSFAHSGGGSYSPSGDMRYYMYADASREVANHYGIPVVDLYRDMNLNKLTQRIYTSDNIHWNDAGAKVVASLVADVFDKINNI